MALLEMRGTETSKIGIHPIWGAVWKPPTGAPKQFHPSQPQILIRGVQIWLVDLRNSGGRGKIWNFAFFWQTFLWQSWPIPVLKTKQAAPLPQNMSIYSPLNILPGMSPSQNIHFHLKHFPKTFIHLNKHFWRELCFPEIWLILICLCFWSFSLQISSSESKIKVKDSFCWGEEKRKLGLDGKARTKPFLWGCTCKWERHQLIAR